MMTSDTYKTITNPSQEVLFKEKNSKFYGYAFPIQNEDDVKKHIAPLRKKHPHAVHFCYAFQIGTAVPYFRAHDDGEPSNSAGLPIYGQIQSHQLTNILIVIVRIFGGIKLGVGGLMAAYKTAAQMSLESAEIVEKTINIHYIISFDYKNMNRVMRIIKEKNLDVIAQKMDMSCEIEIATRKKNAEAIFDIFNQLFEIDIRSTDPN
nr:YigZ family protein [Flavobacterium branchiophilum]